MNIPTHTWAISNTDICREKEMVCYAEVFSGAHGRSPRLGRLETSCSAPWRQTQHALSTVNQAMSFVHFSLDNLWSAQNDLVFQLCFVQGDLWKILCGN